jgi:hypothetical protein
MDPLLFARWFEVVFEAGSITLGMVFVSMVLHGYVRSWINERKER